MTIENLKEHVIINTCEKELKQAGKVVAKSTWLGMFFDSATAQGIPLRENSAAEYVFPRSTV